MTIFDFINDILFTKKGNKLDNINDEGEFNSYMVNRWASMYSPEMATIINSTTNWLYPVFEDKQSYYRFMLTVLPRVKRRHIPYVKKSKKTSEEENINIPLLAKRLELSEREIKSYYEHKPTASTSSTSISSG